MTDIKTKVQETILDDSRTRKHGVEVLDENGLITLKGSVPSQDVKDIVEQIVDAVGGVVSVVNMLKVQPPTDMPLGDPRKNI